jgi:hypothetical protein
MYLRAGQGTRTLLRGLVVAAQVDNVGEAQPEQLIHVRGGERLEIIRPQQPPRDDLVTVGGRNPPDVAQIGQAVEVDPHPFHSVRVIGNLGRASW